MWRGWTLPPQGADGYISCALDEALLQRRLEHALHYCLTSVALVADTQA